MIIYNQPDSVVKNDATLVDDIVLDAPRIRFTNTEAGRIVGSFTFLQGGSTLTNELGSIIRVPDGHSEFSETVIFGSTGADTVINAGRIGGGVSLGDGADTLIDRGATTAFYGIDLGAGDDLLRFEGLAAFFPRAEGGTGYDRVTLASTTNQVLGTYLTGFEELNLETGGNYGEYSGYQKITLATPAPGEFRFYNLYNSPNPAADLAISGSSLILQGTTSFKSITGSNSVEGVSVGFGASVLESIALLGGNDGLSFESGATVQALEATVDGGEGIDRLSYRLPNSTGIIDDLQGVAGFELLEINAGNVSSLVSATIANADGFREVEVGQGTSLTLIGSDLSQALLRAFGGTIRIASDTVLGAYGFPSARGFDDSLTLSSPDDRLSVTLINEGGILGDVRFYIGDDTYDGRTSSVGGAVYGNAGNDRLLGGAGVDRFFGGFGADVLLGGAGADMMDGGPGGDTFYVDNPGDVVIEAVGGGNDRVATSVSYTLPGNAEIERFEAISLTETAALALTGNGFANRIVGNNGANVLRGGGGNDELIGAGGNDVLLGDGGADVMVGGSGDDIYYVDDLGDVVIEESNGGVDRVATTVSFVLADHSQVERLEATTLTSTNALDLTGSTIANVLIGNNGANVLRGGAGDDELIAAGGNDVLIGEEGADLMIGGAGDDTYYIDDLGDVVIEESNGGTDRIAATVSVALPDFSQVERLEATNFTSTNALDLTGSTIANILIGNNGANVLRGGAGNDELIGAGGNDVLFGDAGNDILRGGAGNDTYYVDDSGDLVFEDLTGGVDRIATSVSLVLPADSEVETLEAVNLNAINALDLTGSNTANRLVGNDGANKIDGRSGADVLFGGGGADEFWFSSALGGGNIDRIVDFTPGIDRIALDDAVFAALGIRVTAEMVVNGSAAVDADDRLIYDPVSGTLSYDADGSGAGAAMLFATLDAGLTLSATDFFII